MRTDADSNEEGRENHGAPDYDATADDGAGYDDPGYDDGAFAEAAYPAAGYGDARYDEQRGYPAAGYDAPDSDGEDWDPRPDRAYWRRRFLLLCGGAVALAACAWLFPGAHSAPARTTPAARASMAARISAQALPPAATGNAWGVTPAAKPGPAATASGLSTAPAKLAATAKPGATAKQTKQKVGTSYHPSTSPTGAGTAPGSAKSTPSGKDAPSARPTGTAKPGSGAGAAPCAPADIVLSLFTSKPSYASGERPTFSVYAVSTSAKACSLPYGAGSVKVVVTRDGHVVWDSAACRPPAAKPVRFALGVPQVLKLSWNRKAAGPGGCAGALPAGATGTLHAVVMRGDQSSPAAAFKVTR